jgi:hypothetical protein
MGDIQGRLDLSPWEPCIRSVPALRTDNKAKLRDRLFIFLDLSPWKTFNRSPIDLSPFSEQATTPNCASTRRLVDRSPDSPLKASLWITFSMATRRWPLALFQPFEQEDYLGYHPVVQTGALATVRVATAGDDELEAPDKASNPSGPPQFLCLEPSAGPSRQENANSARHTLCGDRQKQI